jgi:hypothetical protein
MWIATAAAAILLPRLRSRAAVGGTDPAAETGAGARWVPDGRSRRAAADPVLAEEGLADAVPATPMAPAAPASVPSAPGGPAAATGSGTAGTSVTVPHETTED